MNAQQILDEFKSLSNKDRQLQQVRYEILCQEAYKLEPGHPDIINPSLDVYTRVSMAQQLCIKDLSRGSGFTFPSSTNHERRRIETVEDIQEILKDPRLAPEEMALILDSTYLIHEANDKLNPDEIARELQEKYGKDDKPYKTRQIDNGDGTFKEVTHEQDILNERKKRTDQFLKEEKERLSKQRFQERSNTRGELRTLEMNVAGISRNLEKMNGESRKKSFGVLLANSESVQSAIAIGAGASLYQNAGKFGASLLAKKLIANGVMKAITGSAVGKALTLALAGVLGPLAPLAAFLLNSIAGKYINKAIMGAGALIGGLALGLLAAPVILVGVFIAAIGAIATSFGILIGSVILGGTIGISLILFIINSGAYLVPPSTAVNYGSSQVNLCQNPEKATTVFPPEAGSSCPIPSGHISCGSYGEPGNACPASCGSGANTVTGASGHGGNCYWASKNACNYAIPVINTQKDALGNRFCDHSTDQDNVCYSAISQCTYYGYATDATYSNLNQLKANPCLPAYLPYLDGQAVTWTINEGFRGFGVDSGAFGILSTTHNGKKYELYMVHLNQPPNGGASGQLAGTLYDAFNAKYDGRHVHLELRVNGQYYKPDFLCGGNTPKP